MTAKRSGSFGGYGSSLSFSAAYLMLIYRQQTTHRVHAHGALQDYLIFCADGQMLINQFSMQAFMVKQSGQKNFSFRPFMAMYERMGRPKLLSTIDVNAQTHLGPYSLTELVCYWVWHQQRNRPTMKSRAISLALQSWIKYLCLSRASGELSLDSINLYLGYQYELGVSEVLIGQRLIALRSWAEWTLAHSNELRLDPAYRTTLHRLQRLRSGSVNWQLEPEEVGYSQQNEWNDHAISSAAPLIHHLLNRGLSVHQLQQIELSQIRINYIDRSTIWLQGTLESSWPLLPEGASLLRDYLQHTGRWAWPRLTSEERLFGQWDWITLWSLTRSYLRSLRARHRYWRAIALSKATRTNVLERVYSN